MVDEEIFLVFTNYGQCVGDYGRVTGVCWCWPLQSNAGSCPAACHLSDCSWGLRKASSSHGQSVAYWSFTRILLSSIPIESSHVKRVIMVKRESSHNMLSNLRLACSIKAHGSSTGCQICCRADLFVIIQFESSERRAACIKKPRLIPLDCDTSCRRGSTHHDRGSPFWHGHLPRQ
jgi:hypothetical protein